MNKNYDFIEELEDFLGGTFHQDISSPEQALDEFIKEANKECLQNTIIYCEEFLNSELPAQEKDSIIQNNAEVYFPAIQLTPLQWLNKLVEQIKEAVITK